MRLRLMQVNNGYLEGEGSTEGAVQQLLPRGKVNTTATHTLLALQQAPSSRCFHVRSIYKNINIC